MILILFKYMIWNVIQILSLYFVALNKFKSSHLPVSNLYTKEKEEETNKQKKLTNHV